MRASELRATARLGGEAFTGVVSRVEGVHRAVAQRAFGATGPVGLPSRLVHDAVAGVVYQSLRIGGAAAGTAAGEVLPLLAPLSGQAGRTPLGNQALSALNGFLGDQLAAEDSALAIRMAVRHRGVDVPLTPAALAAAHPEASARVAVFVHGLAENEHAWSASTDLDFGRRLWRAFGYTPVYVRYNTGLHISDNGGYLADLLGGLVGSWPVAADELLLIGHSMGGLVIRSACHYGAGRGWLALVHDVVYLGSPHLGAPLARAAGLAGWTVSRFPETRPFAPLVNGSSAGVKDLRFGYLLEEDWKGCDPDHCRRNHRRDVPLLPTANHYVISATVTADPHSPVGAVVGDLLVQPSSAHGRRHIAFPVDGGRRVGGLHHLNLLNHPVVWRELEALLRPV